jgi:hypothetical protein
MGEIKQILTKKIIDCYENQNFSFNDIYSRDFITDQNLKELWAKRENQNDKWESFVKYVLFDQKERQYISEQLMRLLLDSQDSIDGHFVISDDTGKFTLPDRLSEFLRLRASCANFFEIYQKIISRINFDYPQREFSGTRIRGKIDWNKTSKNSFGMFPTNFHTRSWIREFDTPENRLLLLCANWIKQDSIKILKINFEEPLSTDERGFLINIHESISNIILHFPFSDVTRQVHGLKDLQKNSLPVTNLRRDVNKRIIEGKIKNSQYGNLQKWVGKYIDLSPEGKIHDKDMFVVESMTNIDKLYEILIFLEFFKYLKDVKRCNPQLKLHSDSNYKIIFRIGGDTVEFYHEKNFGKTDKSSPSWILTSKPDYTAIVNEQIVAVFDAKNYFKMDKKLDEKYRVYKKTIESFEKLKVLKFVNKNEFLKIRGDVITVEIIDKFFKHLEINKNNAMQYCQNLITQFKENNEKIKKEHSNLKSKAKTNRDDATSKILSYVLNLDVNYGGLIFPKEDYAQFTYPNQKKQNPRYHRKQMIEYLRLDYDKKYTKQTRDETVELIYKGIEFGIQSQPSTPWINN